MITLRRPRITSVLGDTAGITQRRGGHTTSSPRRRRALRLMLVMVLVALSGLALGWPQAAVAEDCSSSVLKSLGLGDVKPAAAPAPVWPNSGVPGIMGGSPDMSTVPDTAPNPFEDPAVSIQSVYGNQWGWQTFDLGCIPDPSATTDTKIGNLFMGFHGGATELLQNIESIATKGDINWLHEVTTTAAQSLEPLLFGGPNSIGWLPLAMIAVAVLVAWNAPRANYADAAQRFGVVLLAITATVFGVVMPATMARQLDNVVTGMSQVAASSQGGDVNAASLVARHANYQGWATGMFGDPNSTTAKESGPKLFEASHYSWSDVKKMQADPGAQKGIDAAKAKLWTETAKEVKDRDSGAYAMIQGKGDRIGPALMTGFEGFFMSLFVAFALLMVCVARVMMAALPIAIGFMALGGMLRGRTGTLMSVWDLFTAAVVESAKQTLGAVVMITVLSALAGSDMPGGARLFWMVVCTVVGFAVLRPLQSFKRMMPGMNPDKSMVGSAIGSALSGAMSYLAARQGTKAGVEDAAEDAAAEATKPRRVAPDMSDDVQPMPALEAAEETTQPVWTVRQTSGFPHDDQRPQQQRWNGVLAGNGMSPRPQVSLTQAEEDATPDLPAAPQYDELPRRTQWELGPGPSASTPSHHEGTLGTATTTPTPGGGTPGGTVVVDDEEATLPAPGTVTVLPTATDATAPVVVEDATGTPVVADCASVGSVSTVDTVHGPVAVVPSDATPAPAPQASAPAQETSGEVIVPDGVYVQRPATVYSSSASTIEEEYVPLHEPVVDDEGVEHEIIFYSREGR